MQLSKEVFQQQLKVMQDRVLRKTKIPFVSFNEGLPFEWEGYKEGLRQRGLKRLQVHTWQKSSVGSGAILKRLIYAIEIPKGVEGDANGFVSWANEHGHASRSHRELLDAQEEPALTKRAESWAFEFYRENGDPEDAFEELLEIAGPRYDLVAYLFFLRDSQRFMPIRVQTFDKAFRDLQLSLKTEGHCTWANYQQYIEALKSVQAELQTMPNLSDAGLVDAHSFCWLLVRPELDGDDDRLIASAKGKASNSKKYDGRQVAVFDMANMTMETVRQANGQIVETTRKVKELWMSKTGLQTYIEALLEKQEDKCALTGITFHYVGKGDDKQRRPSLDRKDSDKHYEVGNLQVVCKFINKWKSNARDEEFLRLIGLVRKPPGEI
ncbi:hypothetical protein [Methylobacterium bullatum]|uniref:Uncharacterized protein n=1 Tax=Methylobacterium bullatum TaxID=570505 RepID=A0AAV4ZA81_9HYPH|nr:hypothetical protein [Methylobacterium bullatum]MBD8900678.1 hypothetical protein [Methylobacterium bullatum]GJD40815.1 hypothetical protein OICFNHDK_3290 [Methylobacterium bullatum]